MMFVGASKLQLEPHCTALSLEHVRVMHGLVEVVILKAMLSGRPWASVIGYQSYGWG